MDQTERARASEALRSLRRTAAYLLRKLEADPRARGLGAGLEARARAIDAYLLHDAALAVDEARALGEDDALGAGSPAAQRRRAALRQARDELDHTLLAELAAFASTEQLLRIRLSCYADPR